MEIDLDFTIRGNGYIYLIGCLSAIALSCFYIYWWRDKRRNTNPDSFRKDHKYTPFQIAGAVGIVLFLGPIFYGIAANLLKGLLSLVLLFLRMIHLPEFLISYIMYILLPAGVFAIIIGTYHACEFIWPKKRERT
jgi:hypothetical protein